MENKNGQGIFYGDIGVATLVVAIIGATFAYFSATATTNAEDIQGSTLGGQGGVLSLTATKVTWADAGASSNDLVPAQNLTASNAQAAVTAKCVATPDSEDTTKYTGCHLYRIVATAGSDIQSATLKLTSFTLNNVSDKADWNYAVFASSETAATNTAGPYTLGSNVAGATGTNEVTSSTAKEVFTSAMTANTPKVYYLLVWVANADEAQNAGDNKDVTGSYTGQLTLDVAGGNNVQATFSA